MKTKPRAQLGSSLILALFVMSLVASACASMMFYFSLEVKRAQVVNRNIDMMLLARGSLAWAVDELNTHLKNKKPNQLLDKMPLVSVAEMEDGVTITSTLEDAQQYFNINALTESKLLPNFAHLIMLSIPDIKSEQAMQLATAVRQWITPEAQNPTQDYFYANLKEGLRVPAAPMAHISELRMVQGFNAKMFNALLPNLIALPNDAKLNINTAQPLVLSSLDESLTPSLIKKIVTLRATNPFLSTDKFTGLDEIKNTGKNLGEKITVNSDFFLLKTDVATLQTHMILYTLLHRSLKNNQPLTVVIWQSKGAI